MKQIGQNLKKARIRAGHTQKEVEAILDLRNLSMKDYETERLKLPAVMAGKLAELYKVSINELLSNEKTSEKELPQNNKLIQVSSLFNRGDVEFMFLDPVIRAYLEDYSDKIMDHSIFDLLTISLNEKQRKNFSVEILKTLGTVMGIDNKITEIELSFFNSLIEEFKMSEHEKAISRSITNKHTPDLECFQQSPALKHFLLWLMFLISKSDGQIVQDELNYIQECAETLKINRSNFIFIKKYFIKGSF